MNQQNKKINQKQKVNIEVEKTEPVCDEIQEEVELPELILKRTDSIHPQKQIKEHFCGKRRPIQYYIQQKKMRLKQSGLQEETREKKEYKLPGPQQFQIKVIEFPIKLQKGKKKYMLKFKYEIDGKMKNKSIKFGKSTIKDFVDDGSQITRGKVMKAIRNYEHPFQPNFWRYKLLNVTSNLKNNYINLINEYVL